MAQPIPKRFRKQIYQEIRDRLLNYNYSRQCFCFSLERVKYAYLVSPPSDTELYECVMALNLSRGFDLVGLLPELGPYKPKKFYRVRNVTKTVFWWSPNRVKKRVQVLDEILSKM